MSKDSWKGNGRYSFSMPTRVLYPKSKAGGANSYDANVSVREADISPSSLPVQKDRTPCLHLQERAHTYAIPASSFASSGFNQKTSPHKADNLLPPASVTPVQLLAMEMNCAPQEKYSNQVGAKDSWQTRTAR